MAMYYKYELWNGKEVVGIYFSTFKLRLIGKFIILSGRDELKRSYSKKYESIKVPIATRLVYDDGVEYRYRLVLDVRKKSKRQIELLKTW